MKRNAHNLTPTDIKNVDSCTDDFISKTKAIKIAVTDANGNVTTFDSKNQASQFIAAVLWSRKTEIQSYSSKEYFTELTRTLRKARAWLTPSNWNDSSKSKKFGDYSVEVVFESNEQNS